MPRYVFTQTQIGRDAWFRDTPTLASPINWNNSGGDWWDSTAAAQGSTPWASQAVADTDTARYITFDITALAQAIWDNTSHPNAVIVGHSNTPGLIVVSGLTHATGSQHPAVQYDGGSWTDCVGGATISDGSAGGDSTSADLYLGQSAGYIRYCLTLPDAGSRPTSASLRLWTSSQFNNATPLNLTVNWLRYPLQGAPTLTTAPADPTGVAVSSVAAYSATVSWTNPTSGPWAKVQFAPSPYSTWTTATGSPTAANATSLVVTGLTDATTYKIRVARTNGTLDSAWVESGVFTTSSLSRARPSATTTAGSWTASGAASLHAAVNETPASDTEFDTVSVASTMKLKIPSVTNPGTTANHYVQYRAKGDGATQLKVDLVQGDPSETLIKTVTITPTTGYVTYTMTLTSGEAATITDYTALYLKFTSI